MGAATGIAHQSETAQMAVKSGTDLALICNDPEAAALACENAELAVGESASVARRLSLRRCEARRIPAEAEQKNIRTQLQSIL